MHTSTVEVCYTSVQKFSIGLNFQSTKTKKLIVEKKKFLEFTTFLTLGIEMVVKN